MFDSLRSRLYGTDRSARAQSSLVGDRFPKVELKIASLQPGKSSAKNAYTVDRFTSYSFDSSIIIPVDSFSFQFSAPDDPRPFTDTAREGDICFLFCNNRQIATGIIDQSEIGVDAHNGESVSIIGRDLLGQFEDQSTMLINGQAAWSSFYSVQQAVRLLSQNTRIPGLIEQDSRTRGGYFATLPGETKISALTRFCEPLNLLFWMAPDGRIVVGKPGFGKPKSGNLILSKSRRESNVTEMRVVYGSTQIANVIAPLWSTQLEIQDKVQAPTLFYNRAAGPTRLRTQGHVVPRAVVVSTPSAAGPQGLADLNKFTTSAGSGNLLQGYAKRQVARENLKEIQVHCSVPGHVNESGVPYQVDQNYYVEFDRGGVAEEMYLFHAQYQYTAERGQSTNLYLCRKGCLVADAAFADPAKRTVRTRS